MKIHLRFGMHRDIEAIHESQDLIDGLVVPAHILAYQHASTSAFVCSLPDHHYVIDPMTFLLQSPTDRHLNDSGEIRRSVSKWCDEIHDALAGIVVGKAGPTLAPSDLPPMREMCEGLHRFQTKCIDAGHVDPRAKKYLDRYGLTAATQPRAVLAPYFAFQSLTDPWYSASKSAAEAMVDVADNSEEVAAVLACGSNTLDEQTAQIIAADFGHLPRVFVWVDRFNQASATSDQIRAVRGLVSKLNDDDVTIEFLYGGFMAMLMSYEDGLEAISHGILYTQDKTFDQVPGAGGVPERYYIPKFHDFRSLGQANLILKQHPELAGGTPTADDVMNGDPDKIFLFANRPELLRRHFLEARHAECASIDEMSLSDQLAEFSDTHNRYHASVSRLPNPDAILTSGGMKGLDYLLNWREAFR
jgi:hypothetical protein